MLCFSENSQSILVLLSWLQAFSQKGVWVSFGHPIADFGHPNIHIFFVYYAMGWIGNEHPIDRFTNIFKFYAYLFNKGCSWQPESLSEVCPT